MKFTVHFTGRDNAWALSIPRKYIGFYDVDIIRKETLPKLSLERISEYIESKTGDISITCEENYARKCPHFEDTNQIEVRVSEGAANRYCYKKVKVFKDLETGEIKEARIVWAFDEKRMLKEWAALGYPLEIIEDK